MNNYPNIKLVIKFWKFWNYFIAVCGGFSALFLLFELQNILAVVATIVVTFVAYVLSSIIPELLELACDVAESNARIADAAERLTDK